MICRDASDFLVDYVAGALAPPVLQAFEEHLGRCENCREFLVQYRATIRIERAACDRGDADLAPLPDDLVAAILSSIAKQD